MDKKLSVVPGTGVQRPPQGPIQSFPAGLQQTMTKQPGNNGLLPVKPGIFPPNNLTDEQRKQVLRDYVEKQKSLANSVANANRTTIVAPSLVGPPGGIQIAP